MRFQQDELQQFHSFLNRMDGTAVVMWEYCLFEGEGLLVSINSLSIIKGIMHFDLR